MNLSFSHEPAVWIGVLATIAEAILISGVISLSPDLQKLLVGLIPVVAGALIRLFVTPNAKLPATTLVPPTGGGPSGTP